MKKIFAVMLALAMVLSVSACGGDASGAPASSSAADSSGAADASASGTSADPEAVAMLDKIVGQYAVMDKINADVNISMSTVADSFSPTEWVKTGTLRGESIGKEGMRMASEMTEMLPGSQMELATKSYYADGRYMLDAIGSDLMCELPVDRAMLQFDIDDAINPAEHITAPSMTQDKDTGNYTLTGTIDMTQAAELASEYADIAGVSTSGIAWEDTTCTYVADSDGNLLSAAIASNFSFDSSSMIVSCSIQIDYTFQETEGFTVSIPDAAGFTEVPADVLGVK